jgi:hypothetical protein
MQRITEVSVVCPRCNWRGTIGDTESGDDGECECPECRTEVREKTAVDELEELICEST